MESDRGAARDLTLRLYNQRMAIDELRVDRNEFRVDELSAEPDDRAYWRGKTPEERLAAMEVMRQIIYGYDPATARLQRVLEVVELTRR
ncbi:MAG: hypothetical protein JWO80_2794 [Bryobacterales bacterium]|nr:hypothetical protein [Bryobacterales bacterium]